MRLSFFIISHSQVIFATHMMIHIWPYIGFIAANTFSHYAFPADL